MSLDIRLGEDYSQLLKSEYVAKVRAQKQEPAQEEALTKTAAKSPEPPGAPAVPLPEECLDSEEQLDQPLPSPPRSPPSPTSPTSPPSPVLSASPASPTTAASPSLGSPPALPKSQLTGRTEEQQEAGAKERDKDKDKDEHKTEEDVETTSSAVTFTDVCPKTSHAYARYYNPMLTRRHVMHNDGSIVPLLQKNEKLCASIFYRLRPLNILAISATMDFTFSKLSHMLCLESVQGLLCAIKLILDN